MDVRDVEYEVDGTTMVGRVAVPDGDGRRPGVIISPEANGLDDHQRARAERIAELGYVGFAMDYHGGGRVITDRDAMMARAAELGSDPDRMRALGRAALDALLAEPAVDAARVAGIGYCMGGAMMLELARSGADLKAVVGFHPGLASLRPADAANITGRVLVCVGADDPVIPPEHRAAFEEEMRAGGVDWQMHLYGGVVHSFTHPNVDALGVPGLRYDAAADRRSWRTMTEFLGEALS
ncbi:MAG TPA: dienelactone hydrolase family protein [Acidimicrobiales bacterium]|nr:dienelactone hydrolase family protein [Acidimicrobiales bacterium]